jgi:xanthine dehydrogenase large subunit
MMKHVDAAFHTRGESQYVDDVPAPSDMLHAAVVGSPVACGRLVSVEIDAALQREGVVAVLTAIDIPGENQIGAILPDEELLATESVDYIGQPVAVVVAKTVALARKAVEAVQVNVESGPATVCPREAYARGEVHLPPRTFSLGNASEAFGECDVVVEGRCEIAGQEHLYLETNRARALVAEGGRIQLYSSTQSPYAVQRAAARILGVASHLVEVDVKRLGGGFGGKEDQATAWACIAALASFVLNRSVQLVLNRVDDLKMTGKRHPYSADFKIGLNRDGMIQAYDAMLYQNSGAAADLSPAVLERSLFHATNAYFVPNVSVTAVCCRTNLHPHTAFRGFGGPQAMFVIESAIAKAAETIGMPVAEIQAMNLLTEGDLFSYGQTASGCQARKCWGQAFEEYNYPGLRADVDRFNAETFDRKRGLAAMPICFGIAFTKTFLNQASALVHVYADGSASVSTGGVEMGQGVSTKIAAIAHQAFGVDAERVRVETTNTTRIANMSPSAASATTDLNGNATLIAVGKIKKRLFRLMAEKLDVSDSDSLAFDSEILTVGGEPTEWTWPQVTMLAYTSRVNLSAHAFYATPDLSFDPGREKGEPFAYHVYGVALVESEVDCVRGTYEIRRVSLTHDLGRSVHPLVDLGQIEGALAQGLGWMTMEELGYSDDGRLLSSALSTYKAPDVYATPARVDVSLITDPSPTGPHGSKAVGEPPLMYGIGAYFSIRDAIQAFTGTEIGFCAPMTPEQVLMGLHGHRVGSLAQPAEPPPSRTVARKDSLSRG